MSLHLLLIIYNFDPNVDTKIEITDWSKVCDQKIDQKDIWDFSKKIKFEPWSPLFTFLKNISRLDRLQNAKHLPTRSI